MNKPSLNGFCGKEGKQHLVDCLKAQALIRDEELAREFARCAKVEEVPSGKSIITQGASQHDLVFILAGEFLVSAGRHVISRRKAGEHVGEMALVDREAHRSATVTAACDSVIASITESEFSAIADRFPHLWRRIAQDLADCLRSATMGQSQ